MKFRGKELFKSEVSRSMFQAITLHMVRPSSCISADETYDIQSMDFAQHAACLSDFSGLGILHLDLARINGSPKTSQTLSYLLVLVPPLRSRGITLCQMPHSVETVAAALQLIDECRSLDSVLKKWPSQMPAEWKYCREGPVYDSPGENAYEQAETYLGAIDQYYDVWVAGVWNSWRCARMFVNAIIMRCYSWLSAESTDDVLEEPDFIHAQQTMQEMADDICASVPFHLGHGLPTCMADPFLPPEHFREAMKQRQGNGLTAYFLLWPLFVARSASTISQTQRAWIRGRLVAMATRFGIHQARSLISLGDCDPKRPLFAETWDESQIENSWEHVNLYTSGAV